MQAAFHSFLRGFNCDAFWRRQFLAVHRYIQNAVFENRADFFLVHVIGQREASRKAAWTALADEPFFAVLLFFLFLCFGRRNRKNAVIHFDVHVLFRAARQIHLKRVGIFSFLHVNFWHLRDFPRIRHSAESRVKKRIEKRKFVHNYLQSRPFGTAAIRIRKFATQTRRKTFCFLPSCFLFFAGRFPSVVNYLARIVPTFWKNSNLFKKIEEYEGFLRNLWISWRIPFFYEIF